MEATHDRIYIDARETLLDAVEALGPHSDAATLVGAQAIYVHTEGEDDSFAIAPFTYDADFALDPKLLGDTPAIVEAMSRAGFRLGDQPGLYSREGLSQVDLLVPEAVGGPGRRAARLGVHGIRAAMKVRGLEGALVSQEDHLSGPGRRPLMLPEGGRCCGTAGVESPQDRGTPGGWGCTSSRTTPQGRLRHLPAPAGNRHRRAGLGVRISAVTRHFEPCDLRGVVDVWEPVRFPVRHGHEPPGQVRRGS